MLNRSCFIAALLLAGSVCACLVPASKSASPVGAAPAGSMPEVNCVNGFSKDYCNGIMYPGHDETSGCLSPSPFPDTCRTVRIRGATLVFSTFSNNQVCGPHTTCDETRNGRLKVSSNFTIRAHPNCPYRGCWDGVYGEFTFDDGSVYVGTLMGTIGVGTHRPSTAPSICAFSPGTRDCEKCYDVSFDAHASTWRIGYEASFHGKRDDGQELCFSLSGDFLIRGSADEGPRWSSEWQVNGTADGVHITFCP